MIAFVRFTNRVFAEFAKEAMSDQSLTKGEILNIRWSHEDPNPSARRYEEMDLNRKAAEGIISASKEMGVPDYMLTHKPITMADHPYARVEAADALAKAEQSNPTLSSRKQNFLQWAQFFAQQGIDPSQLDEQTILYYQQYYTSFYSAIQAPQAAQIQAPTPPALLAATGASSSTEQAQSHATEPAEVNQTSSSDPEAAS